MAGVVPHSSHDRVFPLVRMQLRGPGVASLVARLVFRIMIASLTLCLPVRFIGHA
jgi:hypothetical protein